MKTKLNTNEVITLYYKLAREVASHSAIGFESKKISENTPLTPESTSLIRSLIISAPSAETIKLKVRFVIELFLLTDKHYTIDEISAFTRISHELDPFIPAISSSSVQRYCVDYSNDNYVSQKKIDKVRAILDENYIKGKSRGGKSSSETHIATKDETGKFTGSIKGEKTSNLTPDYVELVEGEARMFLQGETLDTIAASYTLLLGHEVTKLEVRRALSVDLKKVNRELFNQIEEFKKEKKKSDLINTRDELIEMYHLYVDEGYTYSQIAASFDINVSNVSRALNQRLRQMAKIFPDDITKEMLQKVDEKKLANELGSYSRRKR